MRVVVVGSGPAGFYAAGHLLKAQADAHVDLLERLATPWGLVRGGVAPDHPKIKSVSRVYDKTAADGRLRFFGNVEVGRDVSHEELARWYDAVLYAVGAAAGRRIAIPGEQLPGSHSATEFVGWYNGHPDHRDLEVDLLGARRAVVVGNGNVAVDVARMLCLSRDELARTDFADHALDVLGASAVTEVVVLGRRGPEQAAFTTPELLVARGAAGRRRARRPGGAGAPSRPARDRAGRADGAHAGDPARVRRAETARVCQADRAAVLRMAAPAAGR
jgi:ferredoxin--NADP+ reductase